jgi:nicotinic acetylcholine receptor
MLCVSLIVYAIARVHVGTASPTSEDVTRLHSDLFQHYNPSVRPILNQSEVIPVKVDFDIEFIQDLNDRNQIFWFSGWLTLQWTDELLSWNASRYGGVKQIQVPLTHVWLPDVTIWNSVEGVSITGKTNIPVLVTNAGHVTWYPGGQFKTVCTFDVKRYPFDEQTCTVNIGPWQTSVKEQILIPGKDGFSLNYFEINGEWDISSTMIDVTEDAEYNMQVHNYKLVLQRRPQTIVTNVVIPVLVLTFLNCLVFLLPPSCGEKLTLCVSILLAFAVFMTVITDSMPTNSLSVSYVAMFIAMQLALSGLAVFLTTVVIRISEWPDHLTVPPWICRLTNCVCLRNQEFRRAAHGEQCSESVNGNGGNDSKPLKSSSDRPVDQPVGEKNGHTDVITWNMVARTVDTCLFILYLCLAVLSVVVLVCVFVF